MGDDLGLRDEIRRIPFQSTVLLRISFDDTFTTLTTFASNNRNVVRRISSLQLVDKKFNLDNTVVPNAYIVTDLLINNIDFATLQTLRRSVVKDYEIIFRRITNSNAPPIINMDYFTLDYINTLVKKFTVTDGFLNISFLSRYGQNPLNNILFDATVLYELFAQELVTKLVFNNYKLIKNTYFDQKSLNAGINTIPRPGKIITYDF